MFAMSPTLVQLGDVVHGLYKGGFRILGFRVLGFRVEGFSI